MLTRNDIIDVILRHLSRSLAGPFRPQAAPNDKPAGRLFLTEHEIKKRLTSHPEELKIPKNAILSPLAEDWILLKGIRVIRE